ncbi:hypothetical protein AYR62_02065 [Secundilactobacillus paracollinoides]|uniref:NADP-dependent oxidoreductase domain-containing protein n=2 Tax=Secundilactobacillus paracollinoides TaxID=240427 RepID=A0A1B2IUX5_9LACO|nr:aldo/keto reductase [Secundilactobacillus paracollinoides]ANZ60038.1 hypothetical protein AYR61_00860 [Secundilactobacillus paracollinoides]ANZ63008.1 hypothetical protein AYR62_02065 [Secundilactobacillus paracollinoides]ANZ65831.1 hypothetical protein AYR63_00875 [Secundilactobacillus paracollinoides]
MKTVTINNQVVPAIGIGTWHMGDDPAIEKQEINAIRAGLNAGAKVIDTAEMYGSGAVETLVGKAIQGYDRDHLYLISKVLPNNIAKTIEDHLDDSLKRLGTDYVDLYLYHWRGGAPLIETVTELERMQIKGKIKAWGVSNFDIDDMTELWDLPIGNKVAANEDLYNLGSRGIEYSLLGWQTDHNVPMIAYSPVGNADSLGANMTGNANVLKVAAAHNATAYQIILAWAIHRPQVLAIPKTAQPEHMTDNVAAMDITLSKAELALLDVAFPAPTRKLPLDIL